MVVHVEVAAPGAAGDDPLRALLGGVELAGAPSIEPVDVPGVGSGISARYVFPGGDAEHPPYAGIAYLLVGERASVRITSTPTSTTMVGMLDAPLREVVSTLRWAA